MPDDFIEQVKQALENLYDFPALQKHPLAQYHQGGREPAGHQLRRELISAIETLNPGKAISARSGAARLYNLMHLHYVGGMTLQETASELGISLRQAYRDLRRGQESVSEILWFNRQSAQPQNAVELSSLQLEVSRLEGEIGAVDINATLRAALKAVQRLADQKALTLQVDLPDDPLVVSTNPTVAQQILVSLLSQTIQHAHQQTLQVILSPLRDEARLIIRGSLPEIPPIIQQLVDSLNWQLVIHEQVVLQTGKQYPTVLIIDDNEGLVELLERYLSGQTYQVVSANSGEAGLKLAQQLQPDAIIMDLMMPGMDGWELLQYLRTDAITRGIPVIICSVINDPELAYSLGASLCIAKPVSKETILNALHQLTV
ncbi:MAG: hypothetical protein CUN56_03710 [Phototrophicales bacterium]|nr:MAG: hypothetical protein CUN56_03710 [Phototrophicales bacterium]RMG71831.1 MAG: response regulator [Chloroflexota bacterium]